MLFTCDTETCYKYDKIHDRVHAKVWLWALCSIDEQLTFTYGTNLDELFDFCFLSSKNHHTLYFHNLKFDGEYILYWLNENGYKWVTGKGDIDDKTYTTLISDKGQFYQFKIYKEYNKKSKHCKKVTLNDSLKLLPFSVRQIADTFKLPIKKGKIDYDAYREDGEYTQEDVDYIRNDVEITARALREIFKTGMDKLTIGACAMNNYKQIVSKKWFEKNFPPPLYDEDVRKSYKGGWVYVNPKFQNKIVGEGRVYDVNSLYPSRMKDELLPYGEGIPFFDKYEYDPKYPLYIQTLVCAFELKEGKLPMIQLKQTLGFSPTEYLEDSKGERIQLCLTNVDLELFFECYNVYAIEWIRGYKFRAKKGMFDEYIDYWTEQKIQAKADHNFGLYILSKLMLNNLYGKFSTSTKCNSKVPVFEEDGSLRYVVTGKEQGKLVKHLVNKKVKNFIDEEHTREPVYIPMGAFITAYARKYTIEGALKVGIDRFMYADTDSIHILGLEVPDLPIDDSKLGYWDCELIFDKAIYLRAKSYLEQPHRKYYDTKKKNGVTFKNYVFHGINLENNLARMQKAYRTTNPLKVTCAGLPHDLHKQVNFDTFKKDNKFNGKLKPMHVHGGVIFEKIDFTLK